MCAGTAPSQPHCRPPQHPCSLQLHTMSRTAFKLETAGAKRGEQCMCSFVWFIFIMHATSAALVGCSSCCPYCISDPARQRLLLLFSLFLYAMLFSYAKKGKKQILPAAVAGAMISSSFRQTAVACLPRIVFSMPAARSDALVACWSVQSTNSHRLSKDKT